MRYPKLKRVFRGIKFVLAKSEIDGCVERIEATRKTLHMTLTLVAVQATSSL